MKPDRTVWRDKGKKWKPVDKQAALIARKARPEFEPMPDPLPRLLTATELAEEQSQLRREKIALLEAENAEHEARQKEKMRAQREADRKERNQVFKNMWFARYEKRRRRLAGLPKAAPNEIRAARLALPTTGKPLSAQPVSTGDMPNVVGVSTPKEGA